MRLHLAPDGTIPPSYPLTFYRVSDWWTYRTLADFDNAAEAHAFAISDARVQRCRYDHRVSTMHLARVYS